MQASVQRLVPFGTDVAVVGPGARGYRAAAREPASGAPPVRARGVGEILDVAIEVFCRRIPFFVSASAALWVGAYLVTWRSGAQGTDIDLDTGGLLLGLLVQQVTCAIVAFAVYGEMQGFPIGAGRSLLLTMSRLPALCVLTLVNMAVLGIVWSALLAPLAVAPAASMFVCPPAFVLLVVVMWLLAVAPPALVLERLGAAAAVRRSARLVRGSFGRWIALMVVQWLLVLPFATVPSLFSDPAQRTWLEESLPINTVGWVLGLALLQGFATAFGSVVTAIYYLDCRVRREGLDLVMRLERLERQHDTRRPGDVVR